MDSLQVMVWEQISLEDRLKMIAVMVEMLLAYLAEQEGGENEAA
jgi:hypothetical protein